MVSQGAVTRLPLAAGVIGLRLASDDFPYLDFATLAALESAVMRLQGEPPEGLRAVVLLGGRRHFASGAPRELLVAADAASVVPPLIRALPSRLFDIPVPTIAAMRGHALGGGLMLGLWADLAVLSRTSLYGANFVALGFTPGMGASQRLSTLFGAWLGEEMLLTGRLYTGDELARRTPAFGGNIVPADEVESRALALAEAIADADPIAVRALTAMRHGQLRASFASALNDEEPSFAELLSRAATRAVIAEAYATMPAVLAAEGSPAGLQSVAADEREP